jgi:hypothetical protein
MPELNNYELLDLAGTYHGLGVSSIMAYFSILSAYLFVAYLAGGKLNQSQVILISVLFIIASVGMTWGTGAYLYLGQDFVLRSGQEIPITLVKPHQVVVPVLILGIFAGLKFMWDVRHPKAE